MSGLMMTTLSHGSNDLFEDCDLMDDEAQATSFFHEPTAAKVFNACGKPSDQMDDFFGLGHGSDGASSEQSGSFQDGGSTRFGSTTSTSTSISVGDGCSMEYFLPRNFRTSDILQAEIFTPYDRLSSMSSFPAPPPQPPAQHAKFNSTPPALFNANGDAGLSAACSYMPAPTVPAPVPPKFNSAPPAFCSGDMPKPPPGLAPMNMSPPGIAASAFGSASAAVTMPQMAALAMNQGLYDNFPSFAQPETNTHNNQKNFYEASEAWNTPSAFVVPKASGPAQRGAKPSAKQVAKAPCAGAGAPAPQKKSSANGGANPSKPGKKTFIHLDPVGEDASLPPPLQRFAMVKPNV